MALGLAWRLFWKALTDREFAGRAAGMLAPAVPAPQAAAPPAEPPRPTLDPAPLRLLAALQRDGRLVDFLMQDMAGFSDEEIGAAARLVHSGCRKCLAEYVSVEPILPEQDGDPATVPAGFDAQRIRLTGAVAGSGPYRGTVAHRGWAATACRPPALAEGGVLAPAEVELPA